MCDVLWKVFKWLAAAAAAAAPPLQRAWSTRTRRRRTKQRKRFSWIILLVRISLNASTQFCIGVCTLCDVRHRDNVQWMSALIWIEGKCTYCVQRLQTHRKTASGKWQHDADVDTNHHIARRSSDRFEHIYMKKKSSLVPFTVVRLLFRVWLLSVHVLDCMHVECAPNCAAVVRGSRAYAILTI